MYRSDFERAPVRFIHFRIPASVSVSFILPHLPCAARFGEVYANMRNCNASEILPDYADVLAETGTCLQEADEDRELPERVASLFLSLSLFLPSLFFQMRASLFSLLSFDSRLHPSSFYFDVNFEGGFLRPSSPSEEADGSWLRDSNKRHS